MGAEVVAAPAEEVEPKSLEEVCGRVTSGGTPSRGRTDYYSDVGWPWVKTKELKDGWIDDTDEHITEEALAASSAKVLPQHTILLAMYGATVGKLGILRRPMTCNQACCALVVDEKKADYRYVYYLLLQARRELKSLANGAAQQNLSATLIKSLRFDFPPLAEQRRIAHILGTLDDKIELNRKMSETLEAMARALFKSWFVDFDPVRAKMDGRWRRGQSLPGLPAHLYDLFPDRLVDSELGEIPEGWEVGCLNDVLAPRMERCTASPETRALRYLPIDCISSDSLLLTESKPGSQANTSLTRFYKGDILFGAMRPYFHKVCIAPFDGTTRTTAFVLHPIRNQDLAFGVLLLHRRESIEYINKRSTGSTIPYAKWRNSMEMMPVVIPPGVVRAEFDHIAQPLLEQVKQPYYRTRTLAALRDSLLPKLVSGALRAHVQ